MSQVHMGKQELFPHYSITMHSTTTSEKSSSAFVVEGMDVAVSSPLLRVMLVLCCASFGYFLQIKYRAS